MIPEPVIQKLAQSAIMDAPAAADPAPEIVQVGKDAPEDGDDDAEAERRIEFEATLATTPSGDSRPLHAVKVETVAKDKPQTSGASPGGPHDDPAIFREDEDNRKGGAVDLGSAPAESVWGPIGPRRDKETGEISLPPGDAAGSCSAIGTSAPPVLKDEVREYVFHLPGEVSATRVSRVHELREQAELSIEELSGPRTLAGGNP